jgi:hypothetical protein
MDIKNNWNLEALGHSYIFLVMLVIFPQNLYLKNQFLFYVNLFYMLALSTGCNLLLF